MSVGEPPPAVGVGPELAAASSDAVFFSMVAQLNNRLPWSGGDGAAILLDERLRKKARAFILSRFVGGGDDDDAP